MEKKIVKQELFRYLFMVIACMFYAFSLAIFLVPNNIVGGGISGLATLMNHFFDYGVGVYIIAFNIPILLLAMKTQGWRFVLRCLLTVTVLGIMTDALAFLEPLTDDKILASLYGGITQGIAIGLFCKFRVSSGGTEILGRVFSEKTKVMSTPAFIALFDGIIVVVGSIALKDHQNVLYALIVIFVSAKVSDLILMGFNKAKLCYIITQMPNEVSQYLISHSPRGITYIKGTGMYTKTEKGVLMTVIKNHQMTDLRRMVSEIDPLAFVIVGEATEVLGNGFKQIEEERK